MRPIFVLPKQKPQVYEILVVFVAQADGHVNGQVAEREMFQQRAQRLDGTQFRYRNGFDAIRVLELQHGIDVLLEIFLYLKTWH